MSWSTILRNLIQIQSLTYGSKEEGGKEGGPEEGEESRKEREEVEVYI